MMYQRKNVTNKRVVIISEFVYQTYSRVKRKDGWILPQATYGTAIHRSI